MADLVFVSDCSATGCDLPPAQLLFFLAQMVRVDFIRMCLATVLHAVLLPMPITSQQLLTAGRQATHEVLRDHPASS